MEEKIKQLNLNGNNTIQFHTRSGTLLSKGYSRIVVGERGPYIEFKNLRFSVIGIPFNEFSRLWRDVYYVEYRSRDESQVKVYKQKKKVKYADYKIGLFYISLFDLIDEHGKSFRIGDGKNE